MFAILKAAKLLIEAMENMAVAMMDKYDMSEALDKIKEAKGLIGGM